MLLKNSGLVKSIRFKNHRYIGDPINAVRLFNDLKADELAFLDILASREKRSLSPDFVKKVGEEVNMPFAVGGGIGHIDEIRTVIAAGAEKVILNTAALKNPDFVRQAADSFGSSTISVCMDVKKTFFGKEKVWLLNGTRSTDYDPVEFAQLMADKGAGELIVQSISRDGTMAGYDISLLKRIMRAVTIPVVALGGAGSMLDIKKAYEAQSASAFAAGSLFVYQGPKRGVLVNYPTAEELIRCYSMRG